MKKKKLHWLPKNERFFLLFFFLILCLRFFYVFQWPTVTHDVERHVLYGVALNHFGFDVVNKTPIDFGAEFARVTWAYRNYEYPVLCLFFSFLTTFVSPTVFFFKFFITTIDVISAFFVYKLTKDKLSTLLYFAFPASLWWASHEGQMESIQNLLMILAMYVVSRKPRFAFVLLGIAVQIKVIPILLLPSLRSKIKEGRTLIWALVFFALSFMPSIIAALTFYPPKNFQHMQSLFLNSYFWYLPNVKIGGYAPTWLRYANGFSAWLVLIALLSTIFVSKEWLKFVGPITFSLYMLFSFQYLPWYGLVLPALIVPIEHLRVRRTLLFSIYFLHCFSLQQIFNLPLKDSWTLYGQAKRSVFEKIEIKKEKL